MEGNDNRKSAAIISNLWDKATDLGKKVSDSVQQSAQTVSDNVQQSVQSMAEKAKTDGYERRLKKYNPLFAKDYRSKSFHRAEIIMISNDNERKAIDVCEGAIGWHEIIGDSMVLCLYRDWIEKCGLTFTPEVSEGAIYCVDRFDSNRYIAVTDIFERAHSEKLAELENIAYCLGAKSCTIEIIESQSQNETMKKHISANAKILKMQGDQSISSKTVEQRSGKKVTSFEGNNTPKRPQLKWFADDVNIKGLIEMRCSDSNAIKARTLTLEGSSLATMNQATAAKLDIAIKKLKGGSSISMTHHVDKERRSKLVFDVEF